jgi:hypothetical protein
MRQIPTADRLSNMVFLHHAVPRCYSIAWQMIGARLTW